jgi:RNA polymerase sigma-B factor
VRRRVNRGSCPVATDTAHPSRAKLAAIHREYARTGDLHLKRTLVEAHCRLAEGLARRMGSRGSDSIEDMVQVAYLALVKAIDRFDPELGYQFSTYAARAIMGELKRHLRDHSWSMRPSRGVHDLYLEAEAAVDELTQELGRSPTCAEIAARVGADEERVLEATEAGWQRRSRSLDRPVGPDGMELSELVGENDEAFVQLEGRLLLETLFPRVDDQARRVLALRFGGDLSQAEIARRLELSQMNISRILRRALERLSAAANGLP